jgi:hypothetical protein
MHYSHVCLNSFGHELPPVEVTSAQLEARLDPVY